MDRGCVDEGSPLRAATGARGVSASLDHRFDFGAVAALLAPEDSGVLCSCRGELCPRAPVTAARSADAR